MNNGTAAKGPWKDPRCDRVLIELWRDGLSTAQIAKRVRERCHVEVTKNAVVARVHRLALPARLLPIKTAAALGVKGPTTQPGSKAAALIAFQNAYTGWTGAWICPETGLVRYVPEHAYPRHVGGFDSLPASACTLPPFRSVVLAAEAARDGN